MDARPKFSGFGIEREYYAQNHANSDDIPILDDFFKKMLDELYDGVYFVDTDRRILYWNTAAERLSGYAAADVVGSLCTITSWTIPTQQDATCVANAALWSRRSRRENRSASASFSSTRREIGSQWRSESHRSWTIAAAPSGRWRFSGTPARIWHWSPPTAQPGSLPRKTR